MTHRSAVDRSPLWIWWVCGLLLLASTINYMDRQTISNTSEQITQEFGLSEAGYGWLEFGFSLSFAVGASIFGVIADRVSIRWLYPVVLLLWSMMGFATGLVETYMGLILCRTLLGLFEAGHWPCALRTTQRLLPPAWRGLGNSVLQSGTAIGAMVTPLIIKEMVDEHVRGSWRPAFQAVAAVGVVWVILWMISIRKRDLDDAPISSDINPPDLSESDNRSPAIEQVSFETRQGDTAQSSFLSLVFSRRFLVLIIVVIAINVCWHQYRVWLIKFLMRGRGYSRDISLDINFWFNVMTDVGCISAGFATAALSRAGWSVHGARTAVFGLCSLLVASGTLIPWLPAGPGLIAVLMCVAAGALGLFPCYYALSQELSTVHQGKVTGVLGTLAWIFPAVLHPAFGALVDVTKSYDVGMSLVSIVPVVGWAAMFWLWPRTESIEPG
jgi:ACS family hexuronate transporter-like MFS transporter